ncbi:MAG: flagellar basal body-associated FliL family protein [Thermodesulfobacteriota bacterium]
MLLLAVPDDDLASDAAGAEKKAELDTEELASNLPKASQKVELDLEDAPFLDEEEEEEAPPPPTGPAEAVSLEAEPKPKRELPAWLKDKRILAGAAAALALVIGLVLFLLLKPEKTEEPVPPPEAAEEAPVEQAPVPEPEPEDILVQVEPFTVELKDSKGEIRFLNCTFTLVTKNPQLAFEIKQKMTILRDAVYYYLKNKSLTFLADKNNAEALKLDLLSVVNQFLSSDQLETILIEQYLVK